MNFSKKTNNIVLEKQQKTQQNPHFLRSKNQINSHKNSSIITYKLQTTKPIKYPVIYTQYIQSID